MMSPKAFFTIAVSICLLGGGRLNAQQSSKVYIGGGDEHMGAFDGYLNDPNGWTWVRQNADGYYINTFPLNDNASDATQNSRLTGMANLFSNKNVFYETEAQSYDNRVFDVDDEDRINILQQNGFTVTYTTCNGNFTTTRATILKTWSGTRPLMALMGPWVIGGDINASNANATQWRTLINQNDGSATDSPLAIWATDSQNCREGSYSSVKYAHSLGKLAEVMLCPHGLGMDSNWLAMSEQYVQNHEDNDALPDIWSISYYAAYLEAHAVTPEQVNGAPAASVTGVGYYLIHHLRDNDRVAKLSAPALASLANSYGAKLTTNAVSQTFQVNLSNSSIWLDLIPVLKARLNDLNSAWNVSFVYNGQDITAAVESTGGFCFYKSDRLYPGFNRAILVVVTSKSGAVNSSPLDITLQLLPHPTTPVVNQTFHLQNFTPLEAESATVVGAVVASNQAGYSGSGFVDYQNASGDYINWANVVVSQAGTYALQFRYALNGAASTSRPLQLTVNGSVVGTVPFPGTGTWTDWGTTSNLANLNAGANTVRLTTMGSNGANLDYLNVALVAPSKPANVTVVRGNDSMALVTWGAATGATSYTVQRSLTSSGPYMVIGSTQATSFVDTTAANGQTYYYVVTAANTAGTSSVSTQAAVASQPAILTSTVQSGVMKLQWAADHLGWQLQSNSGNLADPGAWVDVAGTTTVSQWNVSVNPGLPATYYRLRH